MANQPPPLIRRPETAPAPAAEKPKWSVDNIGMMGGAAIGMEAGAGFGAISRGKSAYQMAKFNQAQKQQYGRELFESTMADLRSTVSQYTARRGTSGIVGGGSADVERAAGLKATQAASRQQYQQELEGLNQYYEGKREKKAGYQSAAKQLISAGTMAYKMGMGNA